MRPYLVNEMKLLAKRQLENFANAKCSETVCASCNLYDDCIDGYIDVIAQTALVYREMLEKIIDHKNEADKMYLYAEKMLKESEVEP
jgi:hypothetical protein